MRPLHLLAALPSAAMAFSIPHESRMPVGLSLSSNSDVVFAQEELETSPENDAFEKPPKGSLHALQLAEAEHGMPWKTSIDPRLKESDLLFMKFWEWQMDFMTEHLSNIQVHPCHDGETDFSYNENTKKKARIVNLHASSDEYRKIRMTYYDAGNNTQVFNSLWYPDPAYNLPVLGIDLLAFNRKKFLAIVDFQPLHKNEDQHAALYEDQLRSIRDQYDSLKGQMSARFYDETQFFSRQMLFGRFDDETVIDTDLFPAFAQYVESHLELVRSVRPDPSARSHVLERQQAYDTYSADRDPATALFQAMFGHEWAEAFVYDFLFSLSEREPADEEAAAAVATTS